MAGRLLCKAFDQGVWAGTLSCSLLCACSPDDHALAPAAERRVLSSQAVRTSAGQNLVPGRGPDGAWQWDTTDRGGLRAELSPEADGPIRLSSHGHSGVVSMRRVLARPARAERQGSLLVYHDVWPSIDVVDFAMDQGVEEWVVARPLDGAVDYELDLPDRWHARQPPGFEGLVEVTDERGVARLRLRADEAWDGAGHRVAVDLALCQERVRLSWRGGQVPPVVVDPAWTSTGSLAQPRSGHSTTLLGTGEVLVAGGYSGGGFTATAEIFDPGTGTFRAAVNTMSTVRYMHTATVLSSGLVLLAGGSKNDIAADLFDPRTGTFSTTTGDAQSRSQHTATLLRDGRVLLAGGMDSHGALDTAELYDPTDGRFHPAGTLARGRKSATATLLTSGKVLVVGGCDASGISGCSEVLASTELFDPLTSQFTPGPPMASPRRLHTATLLFDGRVLVAGGDSDHGSYGVVATEIFDPGGNGGSGSFSPGPDMSVARAYHAASLLPSGDVLLAGGCTGSECEDDERSTEVFRSSSGTPVFDPGPDLLGRRSLQGMVVLASGKVLVAGGMLGSDDLLTAEVLEPGAEDERWTQVAASLTAPRAGHSATLLASGEVLLVGGCRAGTWFCTEDQSTAEGFEPEAMWRRSSPSGPWEAVTGSEKFALVGDSGVARESHTATMLHDGRVVVAGGFKPVAGAGPAMGDVTLFHPDTRSFVQGGPLHLARGFHTATLLPSGKVLMAGGCPDWSCTTVFDDVELWDPATLQSQPMAPMKAARAEHTATLLLDGKVLIAGGRKVGSERYAVESVEVYDPAGQGQSRMAATLLKARAQHTATLLPNGAVLLAGGTDGGEYLHWAEVFEPWVNGGLGGVRVTGVMTSPRAAHTATLLPSGSVLITGGLRAYPDQADVTLDSTEVYDPSADHGDGAFRLSAPMHRARAGHTATLLPSGDVLVAGGRRAAVDDYDDTAELWQAAQRPGDDRRPRVLPPSDPVRAGQDSLLAGSRLTGVSEASGGTTWSSASNVPIVTWMPADGSGAMRGAMLGFSPDSLSWRPEVSALLGNGFVRVVSAGAASVGAPVRIVGASVSTACPSGSGCDNGLCVDGFCCDSPCDGVCESCASAISGGGADGICTPIVQGLDPQDECPRQEGSLCGFTGECNGHGGCARPSDGDPCGDGGVCSGMVCVLETTPECVDGHLLRAADGTEVDCAPFRCTVEGICLPSCETSADCTAGYRCSASSRCVAATDSSPGADPVGCDCGTPGPSRPKLGIGWLVALLGLLRWTRAPTRGRR